MCPPSRDQRGTAIASSDELRRLGDPIAFIHQDHLREREVCAALDTFATNVTADIDEVLVALTFLREELPAHLEDENEDLFVLLRRRCAPEDEIDAAFARLMPDYTGAQDSTPGVIAILDGLAQGARGLTDADRSALTQFATHTRRHLLLENAIILPFARLRLTATDRDELRLRMLQRRGLDKLMRRGID